MPTGDPCSALPFAEVQKIFSGAKRGESSNRLEQYGMTECQWNGPDGDPVLALQESYDPGNDPVVRAREEVVGMAELIAPKKRGAEPVRIETFPSLGVDNAAFVETADPKRGILESGAMLSLRDGRHTMTVYAPGLPGRDRTVAVNQLETLARHAAARLKAAP